MPDPQLPPPSDKESTPPPIRPDLDYAEVDFMLDRKAEMPLPLILTRPVTPSRTVLFITVLLALVLGLGYNLIARMRAVKANPTTPEGVAAHVLTTLGNAQRSYSSANERAKYASPQELLDSSFLRDDYNAQTELRDYSLVFWRTGEPVWRYSGQDEASTAPGEPMRTKTLVHPATFTLVVVPTGTFRGLRTFALCEDGMLRYAADARARFTRACEWPRVSP